MSNDHGERSRGHVLSVDAADGAIKSLQLRNNHRSNAQRDQAPSPSRIAARDLNALSVDMSINYQTLGFYYYSDSTIIYILSLC